MVGYAAQRPTRKANAGQHSVHAAVLANQKRENNNKKKSTP
jgi:hypothetical protein